MKAPNFRLRSQSITSGPTANTEFSIAHGCTVDGKAMIPRGFMVCDAFQAASLYKGTTAWTSTLAYFKSDTANATFTVFFLY